MAKFRPAQENIKFFDRISSDVMLMEQLISLRKVKGLSQSDVAKEMGVDRSVVSKMEASNEEQPRNHTLSQIRKYAEAIDAYVAHLVVDSSVERGQPEDSAYIELKNLVIAHIYDLKAGRKPINLALSTDRAMRESPGDSEITPVARASMEWSN